jgi:hypothetical protein
VCEYLHNEQLILLQSGVQRAAAGGKEGFYFVSGVSVVTVA